MLTVKKKHVRIKVYVENFLHLNKFCDLYRLKIYYETNFDESVLTPLDRLREF